MNRLYTKHYLMNKLLLLGLLLVAGSFSASAQNNVISGHIRLDSTKGRMHDTFKVWLITYDSSTNILTAVDSQLIPNYLYVYDIPYNFTNKQSGTYRVKAAWGPLGPNMINGVMPTYHDSSLMWNNADLITHTGGASTGNDIYMRYGFVTPGPGFIGGNVNQGANKGTASGIAGLSVLLQDANGNTMAYTTTDNSGAYAFNNIPTGSYKIYPENLGDATTPATVTITNNQKSISDIHFERSNTNKTIKPKPSGITEYSQDNFKLFPNPANKLLNIQWQNSSNEEALVSITDINGKIVYVSKSRMNKSLSIDVRSLQSGLYLLNITTPNNSLVKKIVIQ